MGELGHFALCLSWLLALYGLVAGARGGYLKSSRWFRSTAHAALLVALTNLIAISALGYLFVSNDYTNQYVWQYSNRDMPWGYKLSAIWGGMDGSLLLWCFMLSLSTAIVAWQSLRLQSAIMPYVLAVLHSSNLFFLTVAVFLTNPFRYLKASFIPNDGNGLNPLLQNEYMAVHPPALYAGFTTLAVPYAFCMGALLSGNLSNEWLRLTRRWTLIAWGFLTLGIVLGGYWAYIELGWGGFWAWDPVENASFLPWLTATAFLHSVMVQERKNMLKQWNVWLVVLTYALTVFGTFLTRSGVVQSVHAFAATDVGWVFLLYIAIIVVTALILTTTRRRELASERKLASFFSREAFFLLNNLVFLSICFAVIWGVLFPLLSEAVTGSKQTVGIPFFNAVTVPMFLVLLFLMGVGPLIAWHKATWQSLARTFLAPFVSAAAIGALLVWAGIDDFYATLAYSLCWFVVAAILHEIHRSVRAQLAANRASPIAGTRVLLKRHRLRYGGYLVHFGIVVMTIGITASMAHKVEREFSLAPGESYAIGRFSLKLETLFDRSNENYAALAARVLVSRVADGAALGALQPEMRRYRRNDEPTSEVAIRWSLRDDLYLVLAGLDDQSSRAAFKVYVNPLQVWLWIGTVIVLIGTIIVLIPRRTGSTEGT